MDHNKEDRGITQWEVTGHRMDGSKSVVVIEAEDPFGALEIVEEKKIFDPMVEFVSVNPKKENPNSR